MDICRISSIQINRYQLEDNCEMSKERARNIQAYIYILHLVIFIPAISELVKNVVTY